MKTVKFFLLALLFNSASVLAAPASEETLREFLEVSRTRQAIEAMNAQYSGQMAAMTKQMLNGKKVGPREQKALDNMSGKMEGVMQEVLSWKSMEPMLLRIYGNSLTEEEVRGILDFYKTPPGQALINKTPQLTQQTMLEMQKMMQDMTPKFQKIMKEFEEELKIAK